jgi:hypothetical protein
MVRIVHFQLIVIEKFISFLPTYTGRNLNGLPERQSAQNGIALTSVMKIGFYRMLTEPHSSVHKDTQTYKRRRPLSSLNQTSCAGAPSNNGKPTEV